MEGRVQKGRVGRREEGKVEEREGGREGGKEGGREEGERYLGMCPIKGTADILLDHFVCDNHIPTLYTSVLVRTICNPEGGEEEEEEEEEKTEKKVVMEVTNM